MNRILLFTLSCCLTVNSAIFPEISLYAAETIEEENQRILEISNQIAKFYEMPEGVDLVEITDQILASPLLKDSRKETILAFQRRTFVFTYPSDGLKVKALISFTPGTRCNPTMVFLRGGNRTFGVTSPGSDVMTYENYTVLAPTYRDGVSEGTDEFGGADVNDVKNLVDFIPQLEEKLGIAIQQERMYLMGGSRGGMQMFLALARFPELQDRFAKVVSLSGLLDIQESTTFREDMKKMFSEDFGYVEGVNDEEWISRRSAILAADLIKQELPILITQGTDDTRISLAEGYHMVEKLQARGCDVTYWEFDGGNHCLSNVPNYLKLIISWLEE